MSQLLIQAQKFKLAGSGISLSDTSITLQSFQTPGGDNITNSDLGTTNYGTLEPGTSKEEIISFTGVTQNGNGTATLTGVTRGLDFKTPYTADASLRQAHAGGAIFILTNNPQVYNEFASVSNTEVVTGLWTFPDSGSANAARVGSATNPPVLDAEFATKKYVDDTAIAGAPNATTVLQGLTQIATQAQVNAGTNIGSTGASLVVRPGELLETQDLLVTTDYTYGDTISTGNLLYLDTATSKWKLADASVAATADNTYGVALDAGVDTDTSKKVQIGGVITSVTGLTTAGTQYVSDTSGQVSNASGTYKKVVGFSPDGSTMILNTVGKIEELAGTNSNVTTTNINNLTNSYIAGNIQTNQQFVYNETITAGDLLKLANVSGTYKAEKLVGIYNQTNATGITTSIDMKIAKLDTNKLVAIYQNVNNVRAAIISINPSTGAITFNSPTTLSQASAITLQDYDLCISDASTFLVLATGTAAGDDVIANVCTVSGTTITDAAQFNVNSTDTTNSDSTAITLGGGYFMFGYKTTGGNAIRQRIVSLSGTTLTNETFTSITANGSSSSVCYDSTNHRWTTLFGDSIGPTGTYLQAFTFTAPATITTGSPVTIKSGYASLTPTLTRVSDTQVVTASSDSGTTIGVRTATIATNAITLSSSESVITPPGGVSHDVYYDDTRIHLFIQNTATSGAIQVYAFDLNGTEISTHLNYTIISPAGGTITFGKHTVVEYDTRRIAAVVTQGGTNHWIMTGSFDFSRFIGIAAESGVATDTKDVSVFGNVNTHLSALTPNLKIYISPTATIVQNTTTASFLGGSFTNFQIGTAIATTNAVITDLI